MASPRPAPIEASWALIAASLLLVGCGGYRPDRERFDAELRSSYALASGLDPALPGLRVQLLDAEVKETILPLLCRDEDFPGLAAAARSLRDWLLAAPRREIELETLLVSGVESPSPRAVRAGFDLSGRRLQRLAADHPLEPPLATALASLQDFLRARRTTSYEVVSTQQLERSLANPATLAEIDRLIGESFRETRAEVGGLMMLHPEAPAPRLAAVPVASRWVRAADAIHRVRGQFDAGVDLLNTAPDLFGFIQHQYEVVRREVQKDFPLDVRARRLEMFWSLCLFQLRLSYEMDDAEMIRAVLAGVEGYYVGEFHVHPPDNEPSVQDKEASFAARVLVVVPRPEERGFDIYDLYHTLPTEAPRRVVRYRPGG